MKLLSKRINFENFNTLKLKDLIGTGSFSNIYSTNDPNFVIKVINTSDKKSLATFINEKFFYSHFKNSPNKNILKCFSEKQLELKDSTKFSFLLLENCPNGDLSDLLADSFPLSEQIILLIIKEIAQGINSIHNKNLIHRDIKLENIIINNDFDLKICDFGSISKENIIKITKEKISSLEEDINKNTTPNYRSPEQCNLFSFIDLTNKVDSWALGCILFLLCYKYFPFESTLATINKHYFLPEFPKYSETINFLQKKLFENNIKDRFSMNEVIDFIENNVLKDNNNFVDLNDFIKNKVRNKKGKIKKIKPDLKNYIFLLFKRLTKKSEGWFLKSIENNEKSPSQFFIRLLIVKAWNNKEKIYKFHKYFNKYVVEKNIDNTIVCLKSLILMHNYLKKGPNHVLLYKGSSYIIINYLNYYLLIF